MRVALSFLRGLPSVHPRGVRAGRTVVRWHCTLGRLLRGSCRSAEHSVPTGGRGTGEHAGVRSHGREEAHTRILRGCSRTGGVVGAHNSCARSDPDLQESFRRWVALV